MAIYRLPFANESGIGQCRKGIGIKLPRTGGGGAPLDGQGSAFDILRPIGSARSWAARAGVVLDLGGSRSRSEPFRGGAGNWIWIRHADGTMAAYLHLKKDSIP